MSDFIQAANPPKPRAMHQPRKDVLRDALANAVKTIEAQAAEIDRLTELQDGTGTSRLITFVVLFLTGFIASAIVAVLT